MTVKLESVTFTSGDGETRVPSYLATPEPPGPHPVVLILRGVAGPDDGYTEIARRLAEWDSCRPGPRLEGSRIRPDGRPGVRRSAGSHDLPLNRSVGLTSRDWPSSASAAVGCTRSWRPERTRRSE